MSARDLKPLAGVGVLVTRPAGQAEGLCRLIEDAGGEAVQSPLLEILPADKDGEGARLLARLQDWDWLVFISPNAVRHALDWLEAGPEQGSWPRVAAIGRATAEALERRGVAIDLMPKQQFNSEALLALPELADVAGQRFLIVRGAGGRETLAETLRARGAEVAYAEVYRRVLPATDVDGLIARWRAGGIRVITITSGEALDNLVRLLAGKGADLLAETPLVVISERLERQARELGCVRLATAAAASDQAIFDSVIRIAREVINHTNYGDTALVDEEKELTPVAQAPLEAGAISDQQASGPKKSRFGAWLGYATLLFVLLLVGAGIFLLQELRSKQEGLGGELDKGDRQMLELTHQISGLQSELATLHSEFANLRSQVTTEDSKFERVIGEQGAAFGDKLEAAKSELEQSIQHIQRQMNKSRGDLMIADAEYLLSIANQKLHLVGDVKTVLAAMEAADQRLHDSGDPGVFKVREALAEEIHILKGVTPPDIVGTSSKLLALEAKVKEIPLFLPHSDIAGEHRAEQAKQEAKPAQEGEGGGVLDSTLKDLKGLVTVRRTDRPVQAILLPEEVAALRQVLLLKLEMARAALLRGDDGLYKTNLESAQNWLHEHFDHDAALTQSVIEEIKTLQVLQIRVPFPDISKSLALLRNIEKLRLEAEKAEGGAKAGATTPEAGAQP